MTIIIRPALALSFLLAMAALSGCDAGSQAGHASAAGGGNPSQPSEQRDAAHPESSHDEQTQPEHTAQGAAHESHQSQHADEIHLSASQIGQLDIRVSAARAGRAGATIEAPATVAFDGDRVSRVGPRLRAKVIEVTRDLGDTVAPGDVLAILDSVELGKAKAAYITADARYRSQQSEYARDRELAADQIVSDRHLATSRADFEQARAERRAARSELGLYGVPEAAIDRIGSDDDRRLSRYKLVSPQAGTIAKRDLVAGQTIDANETPIHIVDTRHVWLMIDAYEQALPQLTTGLDVALTVRPFPDRSFDGVVDWISPALDAQARTVQVRADIANPDGLLRAGMFGTARIATPDAKNTPRYALVPVDALQTIEDRPGVFVPTDESGAYRFAPVATGVEQGGQVEIRSGLAPGDEVVTQGAFDLAAAMTAGGRSAEHSH